MPRESGQVIILFFLIPKRNGSLNQPLWESSTVTWYSDPRRSVCRFLSWLQYLPCRQPYTKTRSIQTGEQDLAAIGVMIKMIAIVDIYIYISL